MPCAVRISVRELGRCVARAELLQALLQKPSHQAGTGFEKMCMLCVGLLGADRPKGLGDVEEIRTWSYPDYTRVVVELTRPVTLSEDPVVRLGRDEKGKRPERLYIDIPGIWVGREYKEGVPVGDGLLQAVRLGQPPLAT